MKINNQSSNSKFTKGYYPYQLVFFIFLIKALLFLDPDFGWHYRMGEIIFQKGIQKGDPLSYTMPSFPFIDHEWLTNLFVYLLYPYGGILLMAIIFSLIAVITLWIVFGKIQKVVALAVLLLVCAVLINIFGVRTQVISWIFAAVLLKVLLNEAFWNRFKKFVPILLLFWTNLHGSFAIGIFLLGFYGTIRAFQKKLTYLDFLVILLSIISTLINPYGIRIWEEVFRQFFDTNLKNEIVEWGPGIASPDFSLWALIVLSISLILYDLKFKFRNYNFKIRKLLPSEQLRLFFFVVLLGAALSTYRHIPFYLIVMGPVLITYIERFTQSFKKDKYATQIIPKILHTSSLIVVFVFIFEASLSYYNASFYSENKFYPQKAINFLKSNPPDGQIFSYYTWGGYLDWKLPEKKVFIDGRMPSWKWQAPPGESDWAFGDVISIVGGDSADAYFSKYHIDTILWPVFNSVLTDSLKSPSANFVSKLKKGGWMVIYQDKNSVILHKNFT